MSLSIPSRCRVVILISGRGSNMRNLVETVRAEDLPVEVCAVISNRAEAAGLAWAREQGLVARVVPHRAHASRAAFDEALRTEIDALQPDHVLLAGFMRVLTPEFVRHFEGRLINIHPSLLPAFPGLHTHQQALALGVQWHGCTVHYVTAMVDHGPIIAQGAIPIRADDTTDSLAARVLRLEHQVYAEVLRWLAAGRVVLEEGRVRVAGAPDRSFLLPESQIEEST